MVTIIVLGDKIPKLLKRGLLKQRKSYRGTFEVILAHQEGIVNAMNTAIKQAKGKIIVRIDTDVKLQYDWLRELVKPFRDPKVVAVTGVTFVPKDRRKNRDSIRIAERPPRWLQWMFDDRPYARAKIYDCGSVSYGSNFEELMEDNHDIDHLEGTNWAMRTNDLKAIGGFDPAFGGVAEWFDDDALYKIRKRIPDSKIVYNPKAVLYHLLDTDTMNFTKRYTQGWSRIANWLRFHKRHSKFHWKKILWLGLLIIYTLRSGKSRSS